MKKTHAILVVALLLSSTLAALSWLPLEVSAVALTPVPVPIKVSSSVKESLSLAASDDGRIYAAWSERMSDNLEIMLSYSSNNGTTFSPSIRVNNQSAGAQKASQLATANNVLYVVWEDGLLDNGDIVLARSDDGGLTFDEVRVSDHEDGTQSNPTVAANGDRVAVAWEEYRSDNAIRIWNGVNGNLVRMMSGHKGAVRDVEFSPGGYSLASGSEDSTVRIWNATTGAQLRNLTHHSASVTSVNWSADGKMLATGSWDHNVTILNTTNFSTLAVLNSLGGIPTRNYANTVSFSPDSSQIAAAYNGGYGTGTPTGLPTQHFNVTVWNTSGYSYWTRSEFAPDPDKGHTNSVTDLQFSHNGAYLATVSRDTTLKIWNASSGQRVRNVFLTQWVQAVSWSPDDRFVAAGLGNGSIAIVNLSDIADITWMKNRHTGGVNSLDWSTVRDEIVSGASDPVARVWDDLTMTERLNLSGHLNSVYSVDWSSNGQSIATAGGNSEQYGMKENQIFCAVSDDGGRTFSSPVPVADSCARNRLRPRIGVDAAGVISIVWYDSRSGSDHTYFANSTASGTAFGRNIGIDTVSGDCAIPQIFVDSSGVAHVVWQYGLGAGIMYANSTDGFSGSRTIALNAQVPRVAGNGQGTSLWIAWRWKNSTAGTNCTSAAISYNGGNTFPETVLLNSSRSFIGEHSIYVDSHNQTFIAWEIGENIYHRTTVLSDVWGPKVLSTSPEAGETGVSIFTAFSFRFSEPMNRDVTEAAFSWTDGTDTWYVGDCEGNRGTWNLYGDTVSFKPRSPLQYQKSSYSFKIASTARDLAGNVLGSNLSFSFTTRADVDPPTIDYFPSQGSVSYDSPYNVMAVIRDQWGTVDTAMLFYRGVGDASPSTSLEMVAIGSDTYQATIPAQQALGTVYYYIRAADAFDNRAWNPANYTNQSQLHKISVVDGVKPEISHVPVAEADVFKEIEVWAVVTDSIQLQYVNLSYRAIGTTAYVREPMQPVNNTPNAFRFYIPAQQNIGMIHYNITAVDSTGNRNSTAFHSVQILDTTAPLINSVTPELLDNQTRVRVRANITDDVGVGSVVLYFKSVGGDVWVQRDMTHVSGDIYEFTIPAQRRSGVIYYYVNATDASGNHASTLFEQDRFEIEVVGTGSNLLVYLLLGGVLVALMIILVMLLIRRYSAPAVYQDGAGGMPEEIPPEQIPDDAAEKDNDIP